MPKFINTETGEISLVGIIKKPRHSSPFVCLFQNELLNVLQTVDLSGLELRVLLYLLATTPFGNKSERYVSEMAKELKHSRAVVSKALTALEERQLIHRTPGQGRRPSKLLIDPDLAFRGNVRQKHQVLSDSWPWEPRPRVSIEKPSGEDAAAEALA